MTTKKIKLASSNKHKTNKTLSTVIIKSELIKDMVQVCADDLSTVNTVLKKELSIKNPQPSIKNAIKKNTSVENKVQLAVDELDVVNTALKVEVKEREIIEHDLEELKIEKDIATQASMHDILTGLPNRALFYDRLEHGLEQAKRHDWNLAVMFIDLNKFKEINDEYGHDVGDKVLLTIANRLKTNTRSDDTICRFGGDEFLYLLMEVKNERAVLKIIKKLIKTIELPCDDVGPNLVVKSSIGVSLFPKNADNLDDLIKSADQAMYLAKQGKLGYAFA
ncbi:MAG: GGDEF domain-containing protein [Bacteroidia bacterium]|nr:GGDEF domain-containing protein [Methylotenera sp.]